MEKLTEVIHSNTMVINIIGEILRHQWNVIFPVTTLPLHKLYIELPI